MLFNFPVPEYIKNELLGMFPTCVGMRMHSFKINPFRKGAATHSNT